MLLSEAKEILKFEGYKILSESEADVFMEIEDELDFQGYDANEIANIMSEYSDIIADFVEDGMSAPEIVETLMDNYIEDDTKQQI